MKERLIDKENIPTIEQALEFIGSGKAVFEIINSFLVNDLGAERKIEFSNHDKCWCMHYNVDGRGICANYFEKDANFIVIGFSLAKSNVRNFDSMYDSLSTYAKNCVDNSPWRRVGFVEYPILTNEHLEDLYKMLNCKVSEKYRKKQTK